MNKFDEQELRKRIRSDLKKKHEGRITNGNSNHMQQEKSEKDLTHVIKKYIRKQEEERLYSKHKQFIKCENHLDEIAWLTAIEIAEQHEFYPVDETKWDKFKAKLFSWRRPKIPQNEEIENFRKQVVEEIESEIQLKLEKYEKLIKEYERKNQKNLIDTIIEQEEEAFYSSHPDYKLYRNYAGATKWLTDEEYEIEEEYTDRVRTKREKIKLAAISSIVFIFMAVSLFLIYDKFGKYSTKGYARINVNEQRGQLYIDEKLILGFSPKQIIPLNEGKHKITYRKAGFSTSPAFQEIGVVRNDTVKVDFILKSQKDYSKGLVKINSLFDDAKLFVNDEFYGTAGNNREIYLVPGNYNIELKKDHYVTSPDIVNYNINQGDTINLIFKFAPKASGKKQQSVFNKTALLEVTSNVKGAKIFINGNDSGEKTDYVFNALPFGKHIVTLEIDGYSIYPQERVVDLSSTNNISKTNFKLIRNTLPIKISTRPVDGTIYIDDKEVGDGEWSGMLPLGTYKIRFGDIKFYKSPVETTLVVENKDITEFVFRYTSDFSITFSPNGIKPQNINAGLQLGYIDETGRFISDHKNGPEIRKSDIINDNIWWLGNAFNYKNPPINEAVAIIFDLPEKSEFGYDFKMKVWGYRSEQSYPLEITSTSAIRINVNGTVIQENFRPENELKEAGENAYDEFPLGNLLHEGKNMVIISTARTNKTFFALWKIEIR